MDTNTHSFTHCCVSNGACSLLQPLVCVRSCVQIRSCIHYFTHCCLSNHTYRYTHTLASLTAMCQIMDTDTLWHSLHSLLSVRSHIQIHSQTHFSHCCVSNRADKYTHSLTSLIAVCQIMHTYIRSLKHIFRTVQPFGTKRLRVSASPRSRVLWRDGFALFSSKVTVRARIIILWLSAATSASCDLTYRRCVFSHLCCLQLSANYQNLFLQPMVEYITDKQPEVRQAASYGIGVMAQFGGPVYADICPRRCLL